MKLEYVNTLFFLFHCYSWSFSQCILRYWQQKQPRPGQRTGTATSPYRSNSFRFQSEKRTAALCRISRACTGLDCRPWIVPNAMLHRVGRDSPRDPMLGEATVPTYWPRPRSGRYVTQPVDQPVPAVPLHTGSHNHKLFLNTFYYYHPVQKLWLRNCIFPSGFPT